MDVSDFIIIVNCRKWKICDIWSWKYLEFREDVTGLIVQSKPRLIQFLQLCVLPKNIKVHESMQKKNTNLLISFVILWCRLDIRHGWCDENMCSRMEILLALACESFWFCGYYTYCCHSCDFLFLWWCALLVRNTLGVLLDLLNHQDFLLLQSICQQFNSHFMTCIQAWESLVCLWRVINWHSTISLDIAK